MVVPSPSCPTELLPQHATVPSAFTAHECELPSASPRTPDRPDTAVGIKRSSVVPSPSWPYVFLPQHDTVSSFFSAQACPTPSAIMETPERPGTSVGVQRSMPVVP